MRSATPGAAASVARHGSGRPEPSVRALGNGPARPRDRRRSRPPRGDVRRRRIRRRRDPSGRRLGAGRARRRARRGRVRCASGSADRPLGARARRLARASLPVDRGVASSGRSRPTGAGTRSTGASPSSRFSASACVLAARGRRVRRARVGATVLAVVTAAVLTAALASKAIPALDPEGDRVARLRWPVEYWNALALIANIAIVLGLWLGASREHRRVVRIAGGLLVYVATLALLLTISRAGVVAGVAVVVLWLVALARARGRGSAARGLGASGRARRAVGRSPGPRSSRTSRSGPIASPTGRSSAFSRLRELLSWPRSCGLP